MGSWTHGESLLSLHLQYEAALLPITSLHQGGQGGALSSGKHASGQIRIALRWEQQPTQMSQDLHCERPPRAGVQGGKGAQRGCQEGRPLPGARGHPETPQSRLCDGEQGACNLPGVGGVPRSGTEGQGGTATCLRCSCPNMWSGLPHVLLGAVAMECLGAFAH